MNPPSPASSSFEAFEADDQRPFFSTVFVSFFSRSAAKVFAACSRSRGDRPGSESGSSDAAASQRSGLALLWSGPLPS